MAASFSAPVVNDLSTFKIGANSPKAAGGKGIGGFLTRNASTIGGIALPAIADIATGGLALPADVALSAIGSAGGKAVSNAATHQNVTKDIGGAAASGAMGAVTGRMLGGAGSLLSKVVTKPIDSGVAKAAENKALQTAMADEAPFQGIGKAATKHDLQGAIKGAKALNLAPTPANMRLASGLATGSEGQGTIGLENALHGQKVNVGSYLNHVKQAINGEPLLGSAEAKQGVGADLLRSITNNKENNLFGGKGSLTQNAEANDVMKAVRYHEGQAARYSGSGDGTPGQAIGKVHQTAADYLKGAIDSNPGINKAVQEYKFNPEDTAAFTKDVVAKGGSPELAAHIIQSINDAKSVPELRSFQAPFVRMGKLAEAADTAAGGRMTKAPAAGGNGMGGLANVYEGASALHGNPVAAGVLASKALKSAPVAEKAGSILSKVRSVNNALPGNATIGKEVARTAGQVYSHANQNAGESTAAPSPSDSLTASLPSTQAPADTSGGAQDSATSFTSGNIQKAIAADMAMTGGKHVSELLQLYNAFGKPQDALTTNQKNEVTGSQKAQQALADYASQLDAAGGGKGIVGGNIENLAGKLGLGGDGAAQAHALESQRIDVASSVAGALSPTGKPTASITKIVADSLPTIKDTPAVAKYKLQQLMTRIQNGELSAQQPLGQ